MRILRHALVLSIVATGLYACSNDVVPNGKPVVQCVAETTGAASCTCTVTTSGTGAPIYQPKYVCAGDAVTCCAAGDYPNSGSCTCYQAWQCSNEGQGTGCACGVGLLDVLGTTAALATCDDTTGGCCFFSDGASSTCQCAPGAASCSSSQVQVTGCTDPTALKVPAVAACPSGTHTVSGCTSD